MEVSVLECSIRDETTHSSGRLGVRHLQCLMYFLALTLAFANRICMSLAVIAIRDEQKGENALTSGNIGMILSSFFWGYPIVQIPLGHLARIWSAKTILAIGLLISGVGGVLCPLAFDEGGWMSLCACRIIMGISQGCLMPCLHTLMSKWVPPNERGRLCTITYAGPPSGTIVSYLISGVLIDTLGWRSPFYFFGLLAVLWSIIFHIVGSDSPADAADRACCCISKAEREYIESNLGISDEETTIVKEMNSKIPWMGILTSPPFWALFIVHCGQNWGLYMLMTEMPIYMAGVLGFRITENGLKSSFPYMAALILTYPASWLSHWWEKKGLSRGVLRKLCNTIGHWGPGLALVGICFVSHGDKSLPVVLLIVSSGLNVGAICGFQINHMDLSHRYAGLLVSFTNCAAGFVALLAPLIAGKIVTDPTNVNQWHIIFLMTGGFYFLGNLIFIVFGSGETQWWG